MTTIAGGPPEHPEAGRVPMPPRLGGPRGPRLWTAEQLLGWDGVDVDLRPLPRPDRLTWVWLCRAEPLLLGLHRLARDTRAQARRDPTFCRSREWFGAPGETGLQGLLGVLVGWGRRVEPVGADVEVDRLLRTSKAYDVVIGRLHGALAECRHQGGC